MTNLIFKKSTDVPPDIDIPSSLKVLLKRIEDKVIKMLLLIDKVNSKQNTILNHHSIFHVSKGSNNFGILKLELL